MITSNDFLINIIRKKESYDYKFDKTKNNFNNNVKNNMIDIFQLLRKDVVIFQCMCQSISNHPNCDHFDSIQEGKFQVKCFVDSGSFHGEIHAIINTKDIEGQIIDETSHQIEDNQKKGRWLIHDTVYNGKRLNHAWAGACIMVYPEDLEKFNNKLKKYGINDNYILNGKLVEV